MAADTEATAPATDENAPVGIPYTVKKHDSLARIAHTHHITVASLKTANNLQSDLLHIGQKLVIPGKTMTITASTEAVGPGETADSIAPVTPITPSTPAVHSGPNRTLLGDSVSITTPEKKVSSTVHDESPLAKTGSHHTYTVMKGDTLSRIAHKFHTTTHALLAANSIGDSHKLRLGQKLRIPSSEPRSATNTAPARVSQPEQPIEPRATPVEPQPTEPTGQLANSPQPTESTGQLANYLP
jgi:LysM repeat protein